MSTYKQQHRNVFLAWLLVAVISMPMIIKSLHVCHIESPTGHEPTKTTDHHQPGHDSDNCFICHFTLAPFSSASQISISVLVTLIFTLVIIRRQEHVLLPATDIVSLRAPPYRL